MSFLYISFISLLSYFLAKVLLSNAKQNIVGLLIALSIVVAFNVAAARFTLIAIHISITNFSIVILLITMIETILLERHIAKIKKGEVNQNNKSVEREYSEIFNLIGFGLIFIGMAIVSGLLIGSDLTLELMLKILFTIFALMIYSLIYLGIKFANLKVRYAVRGSILSFLMMLLAYFGNSILLIRHIT